MFYDEKSKVLVTSYAFELAIISFSMQSHPAQPGEDL